jgi:glycine cleavage system H protein
LNIPEDLQYTRSHEWVRIEGDTATIGITDHAQDELGDVVFVELPDEGATFDAGESFGTVESVKAVSDLYTPVGGEVIEVNSSLEDAPENINEDPYGEGWIVKLRTTDEPDLLSPEEYERVVEEES